MTFGADGILGFAAQLALPVVLLAGIGAVVAARRGHSRLAWALAAVVLLALVVAVVWTVTLP